MTRTSSVAIVPLINGMRAIPPPGLSRSCMNVILLDSLVKIRGGWSAVAGTCVKAERLMKTERIEWWMAPFYYRQENKSKIYEEVFRA